MAKASEKARVEIAFEGGQILGLVADSDAVDALEQALGRDEQHTVEAEDGRYLVVLGKVVYLRRVARETSVGFGGA